MQAHDANGIMVVSGYGTVGRTVCGVLVVVVPSRG